MLFRFVPWYIEDQKQILNKNDEVVYILGPSDIHKLFQLMPEHRMINGFDEKNIEKAVMITHKRNFDEKTSGEPYDPNQQD